MKKVSVGIITVLFLWSAVEAGISTSVAQSELERYIRNADLIKRGKTPKPSSEEIEKLLTVIRNPQRKLFRERLYEADILSAPDVILQEAEEVVEKKSSAGSATVGALNQLTIWLDGIEESLTKGLKNPEYFTKKYGESTKSILIGNLQKGIKRKIEEYFGDQFAKENKEYIDERINKFTLQINDVFNPKDKEEADDEKAQQEQDDIKLELFTAIANLFVDHEKNIDLQKITTVVDNLMTLKKYEKFHNLLEIIKKYVEFRKAAELLKADWNINGCAAYQNVYAEGMKVIEKLQEQLEEINPERNIIEKDGLTCQVYNRIIEIITPIVAWIEKSHQGSSLFGFAGKYTVLDRAYYCDSSAKADSLETHNKKMNKIKKWVDSNPCIQQKDKSSFWQNRKDLVLETIKHEKDFIEKNEEKAEKNKKWANYYDGIKELFGDESTHNEEIRRIKDKNQKILDIVPPEDFNDIHRKISEYVQDRYLFEKPQEGNITVTWTEGSVDRVSGAKALTSGLDLIESLLSYVDTIKPQDRESEDCAKQIDVINIAGAVAAWVTFGHWGFLSKNLIEYAYYQNENLIKTTQGKFDTFKKEIKNKYNNSICVLKGSSASKPWWFRYWK